MRIIQGPCDSCVYRRNNKSSTSRNLLCFPSCTTERGHVHKGWCGNAIVAVLSTPLKRCVSRRSAFTANHSSS